MLDLKKFRGWVKWLDDQKYECWCKSKSASLLDLVILFEEADFIHKNSVHCKEIPKEKLNCYCELFSVPKDALLFKPDEIKKPIQQSLF